MGTHERSGFVELLMREELESVAVGLEQGLYSREDMDLPHDSDGCTPLITACRAGLNTVMQFLLERGADATLCNRGNQTALHVSHPALQGELLSALIRELPHQVQLLDAAWRGDLCGLQDLMVQSDSVDLNKQNRDGLTPLMLAVRDVDLFEGLQLPWKYQPVEVVKELVSLSADTKVVDQRGHTALWYVSQVSSSRKEELLRILDSDLHAETMFTCLECCWPGSPAVSPSYSSARDCGTPEMKRESTEIIIHTDVYQDNRICTERSMEPKINIRRDERKRSSRTSSLPSLWDTRKSWEKTRPLHPSLKAISSVPIFPVPHFTQLSKSTPTLMDPPLEASMLLQARAKIHNRLGVGDIEDEVITQKMSLPTLFRTPKHLAPLDSRYKDVFAPASLKYPLTLKATSTLSFSSESKGKVENFLRQSSKKSRITRAGSEDSNSCSSSSQEEEENVPQETYTIFEVLEKSLNLELLSHLDIQDSEISTMNNSKKNTDKTTSDNRKDNMSDRSFVINKSEMSENPDDLQSMFRNIDFNGSYCNETNKIATEIPPSVREKGSYCTAVDISVVDQILHEENKPNKIIKRNDKKGKTSFHTDQSFNILAHRTQSKSTRNGLKSPIHSKAKLKESKPTNLVTASDIPNKSHLPRMTPGVVCKKGTDDVSTTKRVSEPCQHMRLNDDDKKISNNSRNQLHRDLRSAGLSKRPASGAALRARSAVDHVTYSDMFLKISQGDEGPAIYEMFATPVYENLRADSSAERTKQFHTALQVKKQINGKQRGQITVEVNRRKQPQERYSRAKCRQHKRRDNVPKRLKKHPPLSKIKCHIGTSDCKEENSRKNSQMSFTEDNAGDISNDIIEQQHGSMLSVIEEALSNTVSKTNVTQNNSATQHNLIKDATHQEPQIPDDSGGLDEPGILSMTRIPAQPLINTWTSDRTLSPVYQRFLDDVGDGPLTDDLLRSLAKGLISLEREDTDTPEAEKEDGKEFSYNLPSKFKKLLNEGVSSGKLCYTNKSSSDEAAITWTKGELLGKGAYGTVFCGLTSQGQLIAVKQILLDASTSETAEKEYDRLEREVDLLKNLRHNNIVGFLGTSLCENIVSIFMEYIPGGSISSILSQFGPLPEKVFALYTHQILEGVAYLHANRVIHRDLKGNNVMLMPTGVVKLIDFGCARRLNCLTLSGSKSDLLKSVHGTPYWMAPEVINETGHGRKSDIWSIGCTVFEMATGKPPLAHMAKMAALFYIGAQKGLMPSLSDDFSIPAKGFVQACLTRDQRQRPSAKELLRHPFIYYHSQACKRPVN